MGPLCDAIKNETQLVLHYLLLRHNKVEESPKFLEAVLKRSTRDEQTVVRVELHQSFVE